MPNRLADSTSPYLRQHADNPVGWYEWSPEAFEKAKQEDKPVLLSVGYSACHWCHVMAHESFEDPETAAVMNDLFVNVKVDREERPDVDAVYMEAVQSMTGHGGWPMTVWLTPDGAPFYAGTYFPKEDRHGMPSFRRVMVAVAEAWSERRQEVTEQAGRLTQAIDRTLPSSEQLPNRDALESAYHAIERSFDRVHGGLGDAPKFPQQPVLEFLLRAHRQPWASGAGSMLRQTLARMAAGGIHDQIGGGFARYSVDEAWMVPHFEKMLYDNAQLARLYLWAGIELRTDAFLDVANTTFGYLIRDLRHPDGGFYSAEDADSEGVEGKFYVWTLDELMKVLGPEDGPVATSFFGATAAGNFEGANILHQAITPAEVAEQHGMGQAEVRAVISRARQRLFEARDQRVRPGLDHKVIASWNGLALRALAEAGAALDRPDLLDAARDCARFLLGNLRGPDRRLRRSWSQGKQGPPGFLDDYAAVAIGLFSLYAATGELEWYLEAAELTRLIPELFTDPDGGFFSTTHDAEPLIKRPKDQMDNPLPSGNSLAAEALLMLSLYTGDDKPREAAEKTIKAGALLVERYPSAAGHLLGVLTSLETGPKEVAVVGPQAHQLVRPVWSRFRPELVVAVDTDGTDGVAVPLLEGRSKPDTTLAYVCEGFVCQAPVSDPDALYKLLA